MNGERGRDREKEGRILWKLIDRSLSREESVGSVDRVFVEIWDRRGRRILNFDNFVKIWSKKREEIERGFEEREGLWILIIRFRENFIEVARRGFWILIILRKFARSKRILNLDNFVTYLLIRRNLKKKREFWILNFNHWEKSGRIFKYLYWTLMKRRENFIDRSKKKKKLYKHFAIDSAEASKK